MSYYFNRHRKDEQYGHHHYKHRYDDHHGYRHHERGHYLMYLEYAKRILKNKTLLMVALAVLVILIIIGIWLISLTLPLLGQLLTVIEKNGIKGIIEAISPYLLKLWEGAGT